MTSDSNTGTRHNSARRTDTTPRITGKIVGLILAAGCAVYALHVTANTQVATAGGVDLDRVSVLSLTQALQSAVPNENAASDNAPSAQAAEIGQAIAQYRNNASAAQSQATPAQVTPRKVQVMKHLAGTQPAARPQTTSKTQMVQIHGTATTEQRELLESMAQALKQPVAASFTKAGTPRQITVQADYRDRVSLHTSRGDADTTAAGFLNDHAGLLRLQNPAEELTLTSTQQDQLGRTQLRYAQRYQGKRVWGATLTVHLDRQGNVDLLNGSFMPTPDNADLTAQVDIDQAMSLARSQTPRAMQSTVMGTPEQVIYTDVDGTHPPRLAWQVRVKQGFAHQWVILVDAVNGEILNRYNEIMTNNVAGQGSDSFGINRNLNVYQQNSTYFMVDTSKPSFDPSSNPPGVATTRGGIIIMDAGNLPGDPFQEQIPQNQITSNNPNSGWIPDAVSAAYGFSETYDYFLERHQRNGLDGRGGTIQATVRVGQNFRNAFFNGAQQAMFFGDADFFAGALDVVAHELAHGVIFTTSNLIYQDQSGALNEAFSDIFGTAVQAEANGGVVDWVLGDQFNSDIFKRNMQNPGALITGLGMPYPAKMSEFVQTNQDNGGVHINSSIINHAFYQLAAGLPNAVGMLEAEQIFYRAFTVHLQQRSQFIDARLASVRAAEELFGVGSAQAQATAAAFDFVEIFAAPQTPGPTPFPEVAGPDATLAVAFDQNSGTNILVRREEALGDGPQGIQLNFFGINTGTRPSISGSGTFAAFVNGFNDLCLIATDGSMAEICLGVAGQVHSVAISPDGNLAAFVLRDGFGNADNIINVTEISSGNTFSYNLVAPALDGVSANSIASADSMDFTSDGRFLIYDALNFITFGDGTQQGLWSIFALEIASGNILTLIPPVEGLTISFPTIAQTSDNFFVFDVFDNAQNRSTVATADLSTGTLVGIANITQGFGVPAYTGDDSAIVYSQYDPNVPTQYSLLRQPLDSDRITPIGQPEVWLLDADFATIYRRGSFSGAPDVNLTTTQSTSTGSIIVGQTATYTVTITNLGTDAANNVTLTNTLPGNATLDNVASDQGSCNAVDSQLTCELGTLSANTFTTVTITVTATDAGDMTNGATVAATEADTDGTDNASFATVEVTNPSVGGVTAPGAALLPGSRSISVNGTATVFATMINTSSETLTDCVISPRTGIPAVFSYQTADPATNALTGTPNTPTTIGPNAAQAFVLAITPSFQITPLQVAFKFSCSNSPDATSIAGVNTLLLSAQNTPVADIVALGATPSADGILNIAGNNGAAAFAVATVNVGSTGTVTVSADTGSATLPVTLNVCESNPANGQCLAAPAPSVTTTINSNATPTFSVFVSGSGNVAFDPANNRINVRFEESGDARGATSVAVRTQ